MVSRISLGQSFAQNCVRGREQPQGDTHSSRNHYTSKGYIPDRAGRHDTYRRYRHARCRFVLRHVSIGGDFAVSWRLDSQSVNKLYRSRRWIFASYAVVKRHSRMIDDVNFLKSSHPTLFCAFLGNILNIFTNLGNFTLAIADKRR